MSETKEKTSKRQIEEDPILTDIRNKLKSERSSATGTSASKLVAAVRNTISQRSAATAKSISKRSTAIKNSTSGRSTATKNSISEISPATANSASKLSTATANSSSDALRAISKSAGNISTANSFGERSFTLAAERIAAADYARLKNSTSKESSHSYRDELTERRSSEAQNRWKRKLREIVEEGQAMNTFYDVVKMLTDDKSNDLVGSALEEPNTPEKCCRGGVFSKDCQEWPADIPLLPDSVFSPGYYSKSDDEDGGSSASSNEDGCASAGRVNKNELILLNVAPSCPRCVEIVDASCACNLSNRKLNQGRQLEIAPKVYPLMDELIRTRRNEREKSKMKSLAENMRTERDDESTSENPQRASGQRGKIVEKKKQPYPPPKIPVKMNKTSILRAELQLKLREGACAFYRHQPFPRRVIDREAPVLIPVKSTVTSDMRLELGKKRLDEIKTKNVKEKRPFKNGPKA